MLANQEEQSQQIMYKSRYFSHEIALQNFAVFSSFFYPETKNLQLAGSSQLGRALYLSPNAPILT